MNEKTAQEGQTGAQTTPCPSCGHERPPLHPKTVSWVCEGCGALIDAERSEVTSRDALAPNEVSPFVIGAMYHLSSPSAHSEFLLSAEVCLKNQEGAEWVELFFVQPSSGEERWLVMDDGEHYLFKELPQEQVKDSSLPLHDTELPELTKTQWRGVTFKRDELGVAEVVSARGELFTELRIGERFDYWQGYDPDEEDCLSGEVFSDGEVAWSYGEWREADDLMSWNQGRALNGELESAPEGLPAFFKRPFMKLRLQLFAVSVFGMIFSFSEGDELKHLFELPAREYLEASGALSFGSAPFEVSGGEVMIEALLPEELGTTSLSLELIDLTTNERVSLLSPSRQGAAFEGQEERRFTLSAQQEGLRATLGLDKGPYRLELKGESAPFVEAARVQRSSNTTEAEQQGTQAPDEQPSSPSSPDLTAPSAQPSPLEQAQPSPQVQPATQQLSALQPPAEPLVLAVIKRADSPILPTLWVLLWFLLVFLPQGILEALFGSLLSPEEKGETSV